MSRIISIANQKGGVGKTTTASNLGSALSKLGRRVLLIDMDPQGNLGRSYGIDVTGIDVTVLEFLYGGANFEEVVVHDQTTGVDIVPSNLTLASFEPSRAEGVESPFSLLKNRLKDIKGEYDYIVIDCPPSLGVLNINALVASDSVIIPVQCEYFALEAVAAILSSITQIQRNYNPSLKIEGILLTMYDPRTKLGIEIMQEIKGLFKETTFASIVPRNISVAEAAMRGEPVTAWRPSAQGSLAYFALAREVMENEGE